MKATIKSIFIIAVFACSYQVGKAQHVLNGSFEIYNETFCCLSSAPSLEPNWINNNFPNVYLRQIGIYSGLTSAVTSLKDTNYCKSMGFLSDGIVSYPYKIAPDGFNFATNGGLANQVFLFRLSAALKVGHRYSIRFSFGPSGILPNGIDKQNFIVIGVTTDTLNSSNDRDIDTFSTLFKTLGYRNFATSFIADKPHTYVTVECREGINAYMDNVQLDSCVQVLPTKTHSCVDSFPYTFTIRNSGKEYRWRNTGDTVPWLEVTKPGTYIGFSYQQDGCVVIDSNIVLQGTKDTSITNHIDTSLCEGESLVLQTDTGSNKQWNTGDTTQNITVKNGGVYTAKYTQQGCIQITDSFTVAEYELPVIKSLQDTTVCFDQVAQILLDAGQFASYLWKPTGETSRTIYSTAAQVYLLTVTNSNNCRTSKRVSVMETCPQVLFIPNAFTPDGDGINDVWKIVTLSVTQFELSIYNRWGERIYHTTDKNDYWTGSDTPNDVYSYIVTYKALGKSMQTEKGTVTIMR